MQDINKFMPQRKAVIDIGTNSVKLCVAEGIHASGGYSAIHDEIEITRLGEGLRDKNEIMPLPAERSIKTIRRFAAIAHEYGADEIRAVGTAALRKAQNAALFCSMVKETCGIDIEIITGEHEAQLSYRAGVLSARGQDCVIFDIGGGSTELIYSRNERISGKLSLNFGVLSVKEKYFTDEPAEETSVNKACLEIADILQERGRIIPASAFLLIGIGGTITTMTSVKLKLSEYLPEKVNGVILNISDVESQISQYKSSTPEERVNIAGLSADRADIILPGACIVKTIMDCLSAEELIVSVNGIRHAILSEMFGQ